MKKRAILIILDSVGIGAMPDAADFEDTGAHTLGSIYALRGALRLDKLYTLGLGHIEGACLPRPAAEAKGSYGRAAELTRAKDTTSGHWELMGLVMDPPFKTYPHGFPPHIMEAFEAKIGRGTLGNCVASGTEIIQRLGDAHVQSGKPIVYTSADSVFQVAAHEEVIPLAELYAICEAAREMLVGDDLVGRVIARPFVGGNGKYTRTENRRDYAVPPPSDTVLDALYKAGLTTVGVGKIEDIFYKRGLSIIDHTKNNKSGTEATLRYIREGTGDFIFTNLVDFDMLYGHRNDVEGYAAALESFDKCLPELLSSLHEGDLLIISADHGCDPVHPSTDHTREYIPVLACGPSIRGGVDLGTLGSFADVGATVYEYLTGKSWPVGKSFLQRIV